MTVDLVEDNLAIVPLKYFGFGFLGSLIARDPRIGFNIFYFHVQRDTGAPCTIVVQNVCGNFRPPTGLPSIGGTLKIKFPANFQGFICVKPSLNPDIARNHNRVFR
jgi:hypothetical protein